MNRTAGAARQLRRYADAISTSREVLQGVRGPVWQLCTSECRSGRRSRASPCGRAGCRSARPGIDCACDQPGTVVSLQLRPARQSGPSNGRPQRPVQQQIRVIQLAFIRRRSRRQYGEEFPRTSGSARGRRCTVGKIGQGSSTARAGAVGTTYPSVRGRGASCFRFCSSGAGASNVDLATR
jgi:hypothetical protein